MSGANRSRVLNQASALMAALYLASTLPESVHAQSTVLKEDLCKECRLEIVPIVKIPKAEGPGSLIGDPNGVARDSRGNFYISQYQRPAEILVFNPDGSYARTIGRRGGGPGEFERIRTVQIVGDTLYVPDGGRNARLSVLTLEGKFVRFVPLALPAIYEMIPIDKSLFVIAAFIPSRERAVFPLHNRCAPPSIGLSLLPSNSPTPGACG